MPEGVGTSAIGLLQAGWQHPPMGLPDPDMLNLRKQRCGEDGCGFETWSEVAFHHHSETEHIECSCGRYIEETSYSRHASHDVDCHPAWDSVGG